MFLTSEMLVGETLESTLGPTRGDHRLNSDTGRTWQLFKKGSEARDFIYIYQYN